jgi:hypothetical protein
MQDILNAKLNVKLNPKRIAAVLKIISATDDIPEAAHAKVGPIDRKRLEDCVKRLNNEPSDNVIPLGLVKQMLGETPTDDDSLPMVLAVSRTARADAAGGYSIEEAFIFAPSAAEADDSDHAEPASHTERNLATALAHAAAGIAVFPCEPVDRTLPDGTVIKAKRAKRGVMWRDVSTTDEATIRKWWKQYPDAIVGIDLAKCELVVVDADQHADKHGEIKNDGVAALSALEMANDVMPEHPITRTRSGGHHHYFRQPSGDEPLGNGEGRLSGKGINIRGDGGLVIAAGSVSPEGSWVADPDAPDLLESFKTKESFPELPAWIVAAIRAPKAEGVETAAEARQEFKSEAGARERAFAETALDGCYNELVSLSEGERNNTLNAIAYRLGRMVARGWVSEFEVTRKLEQACERNGLLRSDGRPQCLATIRSGLSKGRLNLHPDLPDRERIDPATDEVFKEPADLLPITWDGDEQLAFPSCVVEDVLTEKTIGFVAGESTAGKTFIAIDLSFAIALGQPFFGKATKQGGVLYVVPEAPGTIPARMQAARMHRAYSRVPILGSDGDLTYDQADHLPIVTLKVVPDLATAKGLAQLIATAKHVADEMRRRYGIPLRLVVIDTALAGFGIKDWNSPGDVSKVTDAMSAVRDATGAAVLSVAHHGKDVAKGIAGSFASKAGADTVLSVLVDFLEALSGTAKSRHLVLTKWRDGEAGWQSEFTLTSVKVGEKADGTDAFSAYVAPVENGGTKIALVKKGEIGRPATGGRALKAFKDAFTECPLETVTMDGTGTDINAVRRDSVRKAFDARYSVDSKTPEQAENTRDKAFNRGLEAAVASWNIHEREWNGTAWLWRVVPDKKDKKDKN